MTDVIILTQDDSAVLVEPSSKSQVIVSDDRPQLTVLPSDGQVLIQETTSRDVVQVEDPGFIVISAGEQGAHGGLVPQIYDQATAPTPIAGLILLWFQSGVSADPDDREMNLVVSP